MKGRLVIVSGPSGVGKDIGIAAYLDCDDLAGVGADERGGIGQCSGICGGNRVDGEVRGGAHDGGCGGSR